MVRKGNRPSTLSTSPIRTSSRPSTRASSPVPATPPAILDTFKPATPETFSDGLPLPKMIVFDLDYTLWPFWVDTHVTPPLKAKDGGAKCLDRWGEGFAFYNEVPSILRACREKGIQVGAASRTQAPEIAKEMLKLLQIPMTGTETQGGKTGKSKALEFFNRLEIFPGDKKTHFAKLQKASGVSYEEMLFFDDERRNRNVETLGVVMWEVRDGVNRAEVDRGIREWRRRKGKEGKAKDWFDGMVELPG